MVIEKPNGWTTRCCVRQIVPYSVLNSFKSNTRILNPEHLMNPSAKQNNLQSFTKLQTKSHISSVNYGFVNTMVRSTSSTNKFEKSKFSRKLNVNRMSMKKNAQVQQTHSNNDKLFLYRLKKLYDTPCQSVQRMPPKPITLVTNAKNPIGDIYCSKCAHLHNYQTISSTKWKRLHKHGHKSGSKIFQDRSSQTNNENFQSDQSNGRYCPEYLATSYSSRSLKPKTTKVIYQAPHKSSHSESHSESSQLLIDSKKIKCNSSTSTELKTVKNSELCQNNSNKETARMEVQNKILISDDFHTVLDTTVMSPKDPNSIATNTAINFKKNSRAFTEIFVQQSEYIQTSFHELRRDATTSVCKILKERTSRKSLNMHVSDTDNNLLETRKPINIKSNVCKYTKRNLAVGGIKNKYLLLISLRKFLKENRSKLSEYTNTLKDLIQESNRKQPHVGNSTVFGESSTVTSIKDKNSCEFATFLKEYSAILTNRKKDLEQERKKSSVSSSSVKKSISPKRSVPSIDLFTELQQLFETLKTMEETQFQNYNKVQSTLNEASSIINKIDFLIERLKEVQRTKVIHSRPNLETHSEINDSKPNPRLQEIFRNSQLSLAEDSEKELGHAST